MGYTNYIHNTPEFDDASWAKFTEAAKRLRDMSSKSIMNVELQWFFEDDCLGFNADHIETAIIHKKSTSFDCCKTNREDPDVFVKALFKLASKFSKDTVVSCDGNMTEYGSRYSTLARQVYNKSNK